jgi:hypothetical protein
VSSFQDGYTFLTAAALTAAVAMAAIGRLGVASVPTEVRAAIAAESA